MAGVSASSSAAGADSRALPAPPPTDSADFVITTGRGDPPEGPACSTAACAGVGLSSGEWLRLCIALLVAVQTTSLSLAVNLTPPDDEGTAAWLQAGMALAAGLVLLLTAGPLLRDTREALRSGRPAMEPLFLAGIAAAGAISARSALRGEGPVYWEVIAVLCAVWSLGRAVRSRSAEAARLAVEELIAPAATAERLIAKSEVRSAKYEVQPPPHPPFVNWGSNPALPAASASERVALPDIPPHRSRAGPVDSIPVEVVPVSAIRKGDRVRVAAGGVIPVDGHVVAGVSFVRAGLFSGQLAGPAAPPVRPGDAVAAGSTAEDGLLVVEASADGADRRLDRLAGALRAALARPTELQRRVETWLRWFLPVVAFTAAGTFAAWLAIDGPEPALFHALAVVLVACPCAAGLAVPLAVWSATAELGRRGLVIRDGEAVERLGTADSVIFDKTGTLADERLTLLCLEFSDTAGAKANGDRRSGGEPESAAAGFSLHRAPDDDRRSPITPPPHPPLAMGGSAPGSPADRAEAAAVLAAVESCSRHPVARLLRGIEVPAGAPAVEPLWLRVRPGEGVEAGVRIGGSPDERRVTVLRLDGGRAAASEEVAAGGTAGTVTVALCIDGETRGRAVLGEVLRPGAAEAVGRLRRMGLGVRMLTGDGPAGAGPAAVAAGIDGVEAGLTAEAKLARVRGLSGTRASDGAGALEARGFLRPVYVGDAGNDCPAMAAAHVGIAMAGGEPATRTTAGAVLHGGDLRCVPAAIAVCRDAVRRVRTNLMLASAYNAAGMAAAAAGMLHPVAAALLMAAGSIAVAWRSRVAGGDDDEVPGPGSEIAQSPLAAPANGEWRMASGEETGLAAACFGRGRRPDAGDSRVSAIQPAPSASEGLLVPSLHALGMLGQGAVVCALAGLSGDGAGRLLAGCIVLAGAAMVLHRRMPVFAGMMLAMLTVGGLGMAIGWWADAGFAVGTRAAAEACCTGAMGAGTGQAATGHCAWSGRAGGGWPDWMTVGMLAVGVPAMYLMPTGRRPFRFADPCCWGPLLLGVPGMVIGMGLGGRWAAEAAVGWGVCGATGVVMHWAAMNAGMLAGMAIGHVPELVPSSRPAGGAQ